MKNAKPHAGDSPSFSWLGWVQALSMFTVVVGLLLAMLFGSNDDGSITEEESIHFPET